MGVTLNLTQIDVENAKASVPKDEETVKALIQQHSSFDAVNKAVKGSMSKWCGDAFTAFLQSDQASGSPGEVALSLEDEIVQLKAMNAQLEGENAQCKGENAQLKDMVAHLEGENTQLKDENAQLKK